MYTEDLYRTTQISLHRGIIYSRICPKGPAAKIQALVASWRRCYGRVQIFNGKYMFTPSTCSIKRRLLIIYRHWRLWWENWRFLVPKGNRWKTKSNRILVTNPESWGEKTFYARERTSGSDLRNYDAATVFNWLQIQSFYRPWSPGMAIEYNRSERKINALVPKDFWVWFRTILEASEIQPPKPPTPILLSELLMKKCR